MENIWLEKEIYELKKEMSQKPNKEKDFKMFNKLLLFMIPLFLLASHIAWTNYFLECPTCKDHIPLPHMHYYTTWKCENCGYVNYEDIIYCGVCGYEKPTRKKHRILDED